MSERMENLEDHILYFDPEGVIRKMFEDAVRVKAAKLEYELPSSSDAEE